jgi:A/G-specific adenine glycosylase
VVADYGGRFPTTAAELVTLPGVGPNTAAAIAAIAYDEPVPVIDGNVDRVMARYLAIGVPVRDAKPEIAAALAGSMPARAGDFAQALMDIGATICAPKAALCMLCPLQPGCTGTRGDPLDYPVKVVKPERATRYGRAFVMRDAAGDVFLRSRPATGLLAKMTEIPTSEWTSGRADPAFPVAAGWHRAGKVVHVFTHFRLELDVWTATVDPNGLGDGWWTAPDELGGEALPTLFRKVIAAALE